MVASTRLNNSLRCQPTEHALQPDNYQHPQSQPDGLVASKIWPVNITLVRSGLLWAAYLLCLLLSGVQSLYPATAVTGVYTSTGSGLPTYMNSAIISCAEPYPYTGFTNNDAIYLCTACSGISDGCC